MDIRKLQKTKKMLEIYLRSIYTKLSTFIDTSRPTIDRDLKSVMDSIWIESDGIMRIDYSNISGAGLDAEAIQEYIDAFLKKVNIKLVPLSKRGADEDEDSLKLYKESKMKKSDLQKMVKEELNNIIKEDNEDNLGKRYVATIECYVWGKTPEIVKRNAEEIRVTINHTYDNSPTIISIIPQEFGKLGIG